MCVRLIHGEALNEMSKLIDENVKVDMVLTDPPYGKTQNKWDKYIDFENMWNKLFNLTNDDTPIIIFGLEPFSTLLRSTNLGMYRYDWIWDKVLISNHLNGNRMPLRSHENIMVFYNKPPIYNPQKTRGQPNHKRKTTTVKKNSNYGEFKYVDAPKGDMKLPKSIITIPKPHSSVSIHPTQKPVALMEYLIKTYTNEGDTVLDFTMGSGTTGVACKNTNREFIGIEIEKEYYDIAVDRIEKTNTPLFI